MWYHVALFDRRAKRLFVKFDMDEATLQRQFLDSYERGGAIVVDGSTVALVDLDWIKVFAADKPAASIPRTIQTGKHQYVTGEPIVRTLSDYGVAETGQNVTDQFITAPPSSKNGASRSDAAPAKGAAIGCSVFIVHGHDTGAKHGVARYLKALELEPIILDEQANQGATTVIEKFEREAARASYALVLLTADDIGGVKGTKTAALKPRARQNVLIELGYFAGKLGRDRVCALHVEGVEVPSDLAGVVWIALDAHDGWKMKVAKELTAAGFVIDFNLLR